MDITVTMAAKKLGVSRGRVHQLITDGRIRATRLGPILVIDAAELAKVKHRPTGRPAKAKVKNGKRIK